MSKDIITPQRGSGGQIMKQGNTGKSRTKKIVLIVLCVVLALILAAAIFVAVYLENLFGAAIHSSSS